MTAEKQLEIRKYPNRRYYDATRSKHVTLEEIHELIRKGSEIHVTDSKTGEDITSKVLALIILERDPPKLSVFPASLLHRLIRANEQLVVDFTEKYFSHALSAFLESQRQFESYMRQTLNLGRSGPAPSEWLRLMFGQSLPGPRSGDSAEGPSASSPPQHENGNGLRGEVQQLREEVQRLRSTGRARRRAKKR